MTMTLAQSLALRGMDLPEFQPGWVWLTGAGPGDAGLLTLHALNGLQQADHVIYDALVGEEILSLARPGAVLEFAGKRGGKPSPKQPDISARLVQLARGGARVLRLKGGDPFLFGRGGEEALALVAAHVPFRVIPGISAGLGGLAYAGIPLTDRRINSAVTFVTGHDASGAVPDSVDWAALAKSAPVLVIYMGLRHLPRIRELLLANGRNPTEPAAIVSKATLPSQRVLISDLRHCVEEAQSEGLEPPSLIVIGDVVRLRSGLDWISALAGTPLDPDPLRLNRATGT